MSNENAPQKKRGCLFYGCLSLAIIALLLLVCVGLGLYFGKRAIDTAIADYTETTPAQIEEAPYPPAKLQELQARVSAFQQGIDKGTSAQPPELVLSADDLNALIAADPDFKGKAFITIEEDQLKGKISVPLPDIPPFKSKGRYLNGPASFKAGLENGRIALRFQQMTVKEKPVPPPFMNAFNQFLAQELQKNPEAARNANKLESLDVRDGKVILRGKGGTPAP